MSDGDKLNDSSPNANSFGAEIVYGSGPNSTVSACTPDDTRVMSERVQNLAASIYKEFEKMIQKFDEDCVKELMPLVVNVLESLDLAYLEKEEHEVELELLKEDNEQLVTQYEREKQLRRDTEHRFLELEDHFDGEQKELRDKVESLESIVRMLELKAKNSSDHVVRLEEREVEAKQEFAKLHERYTELFKTHMDYMEKVKFLMGNEKFDAMNSSMNAQQAVFSGLKPKFSNQTFESVENVGSRQISEMSARSEKLHIPEIAASINVPVETQDWPDDLFSGADQQPDSSRDNTPRLRPPHQLSHIADVSKDDSLGADLTDVHLQDRDDFHSLPNDQTWSSEEDEDEEDDAEASCSNASGMGKEVENLIKENTELLETKNALNIVKNDLIAKMDELSSEQEILREEIRSLETIRTKLSERTKELENDLKETRRQLEEATKLKEEEDGVPMAQRKRFTRVEMARVLMERNQYKEKLMELQEAIRWTEMIRASRYNDPSIKRKKGSIWEFFSGLFNASQPNSSESLNPSEAELDLINQAPAVGSTSFLGKVASVSDPITRKRTEKTNTIDFLDAD